MNNVSAIIVITGNPPMAKKAIESIDDIVSEIIIGKLHIDPELEKELKKNNKIKIIDVPDNTPYADLIKEDLKKKAIGEYILYLDPDEIFPDKAKNIIISEKDKYDFFYFPRKNIIFDKWIRHSRWWPDNQLRFFKRDNVTWPQTVHPIPVVKGNGYTFEENEKYAITHYNYKDLDQYLEKARRYAKSEASQAIDQNKIITLNETITKAISEFISRFFAGHGYKDGMHGFVLAILQMMYYFFVYFYYWELKKYQSDENTNTALATQRFFVISAKETNYWLIKLKLTDTVTRIKLKLINRLLSWLK